MDRFLAEYLLLGSVFSFTVGGLCLWRYVLSLRRRLTLYQSISTITKEAWAVWDLSGQFQECSSSFRNLFGCLPTGNISLREVICSFEDQDLFEKKLTDLRFSEGSFFQEGEMRHTHQQIHLQGAYISLSSRPILCLWAYDITQQQQIKRDLQENVRQAEEKCSYWRHFLDVFPFPIWHRRPKDLRLDYCNKAYAEATGLSPERILLEMPSPLSPALFGDGRNLAARARETGTLQCSSQGGVLRGEHHHFLVHEIPLGEGTLGFSFDVTEHHQIRRRL
ncbi:MAG: PAS domain-containing protein, partial [Holosporales bacterium]|nr:PAS domain-containing protein [Holosporales bacterium]